MAMAMAIAGTDDGGNADDSGVALQFPDEDEDDEMDEELEERLEQDIDQGMTLKVGMLYVRVRCIVSLV